MEQKNSLIMYPEIAKEWHPIKNGDLTPNNVKGGSGKHVWWICNNGHEWTASIKNRVSHNSKCPYCCNRKACKDNCLAVTHPDLAAQWHPTKNGNLTVYDVTAGSNKKVWWKCPVNDDHEWQSLIHNRGSHGNGCPCCVRRVAVKSNSLATTHPELAEEWHPTKNGELTPSDVVYGRTKKVWWKCKKGHEWLASINNRSGVNTTGCPFCKESKGEKKIRTYLIDKGIKFKPQFGFVRSEIKSSKFDFAVLKGVIEFHGEQHYVPCRFGATKKTQIEMLLKNVRRDLKKEKWCKTHNVPLLVIPYWDLNRADEILDAFFNDKEIVISEEPEIVKRYQSIRSKA